MILLTQQGKCLIFLFLIVSMIIYSIVFISKATMSVRLNFGSKKRLNYQFHIENLYKYQPGEEPIEYLNISVFNSFIDKYCHVEDLYATTKCLNELTNFEEIKKPVRIENEKRLIYYHTIWPEVKLNNLIDLRIRKLNVHSYLATQNLLHTKLVIWIFKPLQRNFSVKFKLMFQNYLNKKIIELKLIDLKKLCSKNLFFNTRFSACSSIKINETRHINAAKDLIKFLLLNNYGGIFIDYDFIYLKDLKPFWLTNFGYRWSHLNDFSFSLLGIMKNIDTEMNEILNRLLLSSSDNSTDKFLQSFHPFSVRDQIITLNKGNLFDYKSFKIYHSALFDPSWLCHNHIIDKNKFNICYFQDIFVLKVENFSITKFFNGAFLYHIHNSDIRISKKNYSNESYFCHLESYYKTQLKIF
jgi:hypothetical protein